MVTCTGLWPLPEWRCGEARRADVGASSSSFLEPKQSGARRKNGHGRVVGKGEAGLGHVTRGARGGDMP
jgi:hypothetical protein